MVSFNANVILVLKKNIAVFILLMIPGIFVFAQSESGGEQKENITYQKDIVPLLKSNCRPCHYPGGTVFKKLPFEEYVVVKKLGIKLNTRLKENSRKKIISLWVESGSFEK